MKWEIPKYITIIQQHIFDFNQDCEENNLFMNRIKSRRRKRRNKLAMSVLKSIELGLDENNAVTTSNPLELLRIFDNNLPDTNAHGDVMKWSDDIGERGKRVSDWWTSVMVASDGE